MTRTRGWREERQALLRKPGEVITIADLQHKLRDSTYRLAPNDIVLMQTGAATRWGTADSSVRHAP